MYRQSWLELRVRRLLWDGQVILMECLDTMMSLPVVSYQHISVLRSLSVWGESSRTARHLEYDSQYLIINLVQHLGLQESFLPGILMLRKRELSPRNSLGHRIGLETLVFGALESCA